ncbi:MAG TPA: hypothetical protein VKD25_06430 [Burkholderiales bacterium]|nr:hypothetical protein [Burkholderiales bacterium]
MDLFSEAAVAAHASTAGWVAWLYVATNSLRIIAYAPQIRAVLRAQDGAVAVSITTWALFTFANLTATLYGWLVIHDSAFCAIFTGNLMCTAAVTFIATLKRVKSRRASRDCVLVNDAAPV